MHLGNMTLKVWNIQYWKGKSETKTKSANVYIFLFPNLRVCVMTFSGSTMLLKSYFFLREITGCPHGWVQVKSINIKGDEKLSLNSFFYELSHIISGLYIFWPARKIPPSPKFFPVFVEMARIYIPATECSRQIVLEKL